MFANIDSKIMFWLIIIAPCYVFFMVLALLDGTSSEHLILLSVIFIFSVFFWSNKALHICPVCHSRIISWNLRCRKCEKELLKLG